MANDIVAGLFGLTPSQIQQQQQAAIQQQAAAYAQQSPFERAAAGMYQGGAGLAGIGAGMMGWKNTEVEAAKQREAALQGANMHTPEGLRALAAKFQSAGMQQQAMIAAAKANEMDKLAQNELLERQKQSLAERKQTFQEGEAFDLKKTQAEAVIRQNDERISDAKTTAQERNALLAQNNEIRKMLAEIKVKGAGGGESIQPLPYIDPTTGKAVWGTIAEARGKPAAAFDPVTKQLVAEAVSEGTVKGKDVAMIGGKYDALDAISSAQGLLEKGIYTGGYAPAGKAIAKYTPGMDKTKVANTEEFLSHIGNVVIPRLQEFGGNDSVEELKYLRAVSAGDITLEKEAIKKILSAAERKINAGIRRVAKGKQQTSGDGLSIEERLNKYK